MIKLFDFKFIILLTLAIVIYFMYKDIDEQRDRIHKLEEKCRLLYEEKHTEKHTEKQITNSNNLN